MNKQEQKLNKYGVTKVRYWRPFSDTYICLLFQGKTVVARGVSSCSPNDQFVKKTGRAIALGHALQALGKGQDVGQIHKPKASREDSRMDWLHDVYGQTGFYMPEPDKDEKIIFEKDLV